MRIEEYSWLSLVFFFVFFVHVGLGYVFNHEAEPRANFDESGSNSGIFKNVKIRKVTV